jgi:hypothetical protein
MKIIAATFLVAALASGVCRAETPTPEKIASTFFDTMMKGDSAKAVDDFFSLNAKFKDKIQQLQLLKSQLNTVTQLYGDAFAVELVSVEDLTPSLQRRVYITKHEWIPITWEMYFYKPKSEWVTVQLLAVDQFQIIGRKK